MNTKERLRAAVKAGVKIKVISEKAEVSYFRLKSVIKPSSYNGESNFDRFEEARINDALDSIAAALSI